MSQNKPQSFTPLASGTNVRITKNDGLEIDGVLRRFNPIDGTVLLTQPLGENDPDLQTTIYVKNYVRLESPIPATEANARPSGLIGKTVDLFYDDQAAGNTAISSPVTGDIESINLQSGQVTLLVGDPVVTYVFNDYYYFEEV